VNRVVVLGCAGSGKTTFSRLLGSRARLPVVCLDDIWQRDWTDANLPEFRRLIQSAHSGDRWISDGNFAVATFDLRLPRADLVIWIDRPRLVCIGRAVMRAARPSEPHRPRDLLKVLSFIWNFDQLNRPRIESQRQKFGPDVPVVRLKRQIDVDGFLRDVEPVPE
jgi:adenylate kinase family enzyme